MENAYYKYIGLPLDEVKKELESKGFVVETKIYSESKRKDRVLVVKVEEKQDKLVLVCGEFLFDI